MGTTVFVLSSTDGESKPVFLYDDKHVIKTKTETFTSPSTGKEKILCRHSACKAKGEPVFVVCVLKTDENGQLTKQVRSYQSLLTLELVSNSFELKW